MALVSLVLHLTPYTHAPLPVVCQIHFVNMGSHNKLAHQVLKALNMEAQHRRQVPNGHLLHRTLLQLAPLARPVFPSAQALWPHKAVQTAQQADRAK